MASKANPLNPRPRRVIRLRMFFTLKISLADEAVPFVDKLRDTMPREVFLRRALEIGLCQIVADAAHVNNDKLIHILRGNSNEWRLAKSFFFSADGPDPSPPML
jgi:hypothetical protein